MTQPGSGLPRWFERTAVGAGLLLLSPILLLCAILVKLSSPGPALFRQERVGKKAAPFILLKYRTMKTGASGAQVTRTGDTRITGIGRFLRKLKLDELPELWNVIRGDLSLVGPRPEVPKYVNIRDPLWMKTLSVRPGITDPVTLRLRSEEDLLPQGVDPEHFYLTVLQPVKLEGYVEYLRRRTWWTDVVVLVETIIAVVVPSIAPPPSLQDLDLPAEELFRLRRWPVRTDS